MSILVQFEVTCYGEIVANCYSNGQWIDEYPEVLLQVLMDEIETVDMTWAKPQVEKWLQHKYPGCTIKFADHLYDMSDVDVAFLSY